MTPEEPRPRRGQRKKRDVSTRRLVFEVGGSWRFPSAEEIERRFEELIRSRWSGAESGAPADVFVWEDEIWVEVDLPGVEQGEVRAEIEGRTLVIEATRHPTTPPGETRIARLERPRGPLRRRVPLPTEVGAPHLELRLESGVLRVRVRPEKRT